MALFTSLTAAAAPAIGKLIKQGKFAAAAGGAGASNDKTESVLAGGAGSAKDKATAARADGLYKEDNGNFTRVVNGQNYLVTPQDNKYNGIRAEYYETYQKQPQYLAEKGLLDPAPKKAATLFDSAATRQYAKGGSGKEYCYNSQTGNIGITRPDGRVTYVAESDPQYANTKQAVLTDIDAFNRTGGRQAASGAGALSAAADPYAKLQASIKEGDYNAATEQLVGQYLPQLGSMANSDLAQQQFNYYQQAALSYDEALPLARQYLQGQYTAAAADSAEAASQRLDRAGIYDSLYGQALAMDAEQNAWQAVDQEAAELAAQLVGFNRQQALDLLQLNQNAYDMQFKAAESSMNYILRIIQQLAAQAASERDDAARQGLWEIESNLRQGIISESEALYILRMLLR